MCQVIIRSLYDMHTHSLTHSLTHIYMYTLIHRSNNLPHHSSTGPHHSTAAPQPTPDERECVKLLLGPCMTCTLTHSYIHEKTHTQI